jgi:hypothetical protein
MLRLLGILALAPFMLLAIAACVWGINDWISPPFTDEELKNFVDSWQPSALVTTFSVATLGVAALVVLPATIIVKEHFVRAIAIGTFLLTIAGAGIILRNHVAMTHRVTELTGQTFGGLNGWGIF